MRSKRKELNHLANKPLRELSQEERERVILDLERQRAEIVWDIEQVMRLIAKQTGERSLKKRKFKLGQSPNDFGYKVKKR